MSLAVPYVIRAAAAVAPGRQVSVAGHPVGCADLDQATQAEARRLLARGYRPPGLLEALDASSPEELLCALAGSRIGLVLTRRPVEDPPTGQTTLTWRSSRARSGRSRRCSKSTTGTGGGWSA